MSQTALPMPGTVKAASPACGSSGGWTSIGPEPLGQGLGDLSGVSRRPDARAIDAAAAAVDVDALDHQVEVVFPVIDDVVAQQDLGEAGAVGLHARVARDTARPSPCRQRSSRGRRLASTAAPAAASPGYKPKTSRGTPASMKAETMRYGVHGSCGPGFSTNPSCRGITGSHKRMHARRIGRQHRRQHRRLRLVADDDAARFHRPSRA